MYSFRFLFAPRPLLAPGGSAQTLEDLQRVLGPDEFESVYLHVFLNGHAGTRRTERWLFLALVRCYRSPLDVPEVVRWAEVANTVPQDHNRGVVARDARRALTNGTAQKLYDLRLRHLLSAWLEELERAQRLEDPEIRPYPGRTMSIAAVTELLQVVATRTPQRHPNGQTAIIVLRGHIHDALQWTRSLADRDVLRRIARDLPSDAANFVIRETDRVMRDFLPNWFDRKLVKLQQDLVQATGVYPAFPGENRLAYTQSRRIGEGQEGFIDEVLDTMAYGTPSRAVAIKSVRFRSQTGASAASRYYRFARLTRVIILWRQAHRLSAPNIVPLLDVLQSPTAPIDTALRMVMPRLDALDAWMAQKARDGPAAIADAQSFVPQILHGTAKGLEWLHAQGVVHGDLHLKNVLLDNVTDPAALAPIAYLADFGISRMVHPDPNSTTMAPLSSFAMRFAAPEILTPDTPDPDRPIFHPATRPELVGDVYALARTWMSLLNWEVNGPNVTNANAGQQTAVETFAYVYDRDIPAEVQRLPLHRYPFRDDVRAAFRALLVEMQNRDEPWRRPSAANIRARMDGIV